LKVASTSMEIWLSQLCGEDAIITPISPEDEEIRRELGYRGPQNYDIPWQNYSIKDWGRLFIKKKRPKPFKNHDSISKVLRHYGKYSDYFSFCFERNPWDKAVSFYYYALYQRGAQLEEVSISDLLRDAPGRFSNWNRYTNEKDEIIVDHVAKFENLEEELDYICQRIGVSRAVMGPLPRAKTAYRNTKKPYQELLTDEQAERIQHLCRKEIAHFGYTFEDSTPTPKKTWEKLPAY